MRKVLIGLNITSPSEVGLQLAPLHPNKTGFKIISMLGIDIYEYYSRYDRVNVCPRPTAGVVDPATVEYDVLNLMGVLRDRSCILLGQNVAGCFGMSSTDYELFEWNDPVKSVERFVLGRLPFRWAVVPHPSGLNRYYNNPAARARFKEFFDGF